MVSNGISSANNPIDKDNASTLTQQSNDAADALDFSDTELTAIVALFIDPIENGIDSGDVHKLSIWGRDAQGKRYDNIASFVDCYLISGVSVSVKLFAGCAVGGVSPGVAGIRARMLRDDGNEIESNEVSIQVFAKELRRINKKIHINLHDWQSEGWFDATGLVEGQFYQATMSGNLPIKAEIEIVPDENAFKKICRNTLPEGADQVACYFYAVEDRTIIIVSKLPNQTLNASISLEQVAEIDQSTVSYFANSAVPLSLGQPVSSYIFSNEVGVNSTHYYQYKGQGKPFPSLKVSLLHAHPILLDVNWASGACKQEMFTRTKSKTECIIPRYQTGELKIKVEGNSNEYQHDAPAAVEGGSRYRLDVELIL